MKRFIWILAFLAISSTSTAGSIDSVGSYKGKIKSIAVGHWGHVGVELDGVSTCSGRTEVILLSTEPLFKEMLSTLLAAQTSQQDVVLYRITTNTQIFAPSHTYCVVKFAAIGNFSIW
jgi:hypothetical protein